jgi:hypothetical protein
MKWFHHECAARHDPKLQILGATYGAEGLGVFWSLLEEIGQHSDSFHLKVLGISQEVDQHFANAARNPQESGLNLPQAGPGLANVPRLPLRILAKNLFTSQRKLKAIIETCVEIGLFDNRKWTEFNVLHSPSFEHRADDYTRRLQRKSVPPGTDSGHGPDNRATMSGARSDPLRSPSELSTLETEQMRGRVEGEVLVQSTSGKTQLSTSDQDEERLDADYVIEPDDTAFQQYAKDFRLTLSRWNEDRSNKFQWDPAETELRKLFFGGEHARKLTMCYNAYKLLAEKINYPELVLRALRLMLKASQKTRIVNPFGWMWSCLHGNGDGTTPWVQLLTAEEEQSFGSVARRLIPGDRSP